MSFFGQVKNEGLAQVGKAELALSRGDSALAVELAERRLRQLPLEDRVERAPVLELLVRAGATLGNVDVAKPALAELEKIEIETKTRFLTASAKLAAGALASAEARHEEARIRYEDAVDLLEREGAPFEAARARLDLAGTLLELGRRPT